MLLMLWWKGFLAFNGLHQTLCVIEYRANNRGEMKDCDWCRYGFQKYIGLREREKHSNLQRAFTYVVWCCILTQQHHVSLNHCTGVCWLTEMHLCSTLSCHFFEFWIIGIFVWKRHKRSNKETWEEAKKCVETFDTYSSPSPTNKAFPSQHVTMHIATAA